MGRLTRDQIIAAGLAKAGHDNTITSTAATAFQAMLDDIYASFAWPFLRKRAAVTMAAGQGAFDIGNGSGAPAAVTEWVKSIMAIKVADTVSDSFAADLPLTDADGLSPNDEPAWHTSTGTPQKMLREPKFGDPWKWTLTPVPAPEKAYRLLVEMHAIPAALSSGSAIPAYPFDDTLIEAVCAWAAFYNDDPRSVASDGKVAALLRADRVKLAPTKRMGLDTQRFTRGG